MGSNNLNVPSSTGEIYVKFFRLHLTTWLYP